MTDEVLRLLIVVGVFVVAGAIAVGFNRYAKPDHPTVSVSGEGDRPGIVLFTALDCDTCTSTIAMLRQGGFPFREITHELEPQRFESWGVLAVPLTVVVDQNSDVVDVMTGVPSHRRFTRAVGAAGIEIRP